MTPAPVVEAWAIKAPEYKRVHDDIPLQIPVIFGILSWVNFQWAIINLQYVGMISLVNVVAGIGLWAMGAFVMSKVGYRCVRVRVEEIEE